MNGYHLGAEFVPVPSEEASLEELLLEAASVVEGSLEVEVEASDSSGTDATSSRQDINTSLTA